MAKSRLVTHPHDLSSKIIRRSSPRTQPRAPPIAPLSLSLHLADRKPSLAKIPRPNPDRQPTLATQPHNPVNPPPQPTQPHWIGSSDL
uniref:Uncharacterized protein n=1 Tax=Fagus sylvatica TaxID=28930 RepID=A0A2N9EEX3_FAGSY